MVFVTLPDPTHTRNVWFRFIVEGGDYDDDEMSVSLVEENGVPRETSFTHGMKAWFVQLETSKIPGRFQDFSRTFSFFSRT